MFRMKDPTDRLHTVKHSFSKDATLMDTCLAVHASLEQSLRPHPMPASFHYVTNVPPKRRVFVDAEYDRTLEELDLCTNCIVEVEPGRTPQVGPDGNVVAARGGLIEIRINTELLQISRTI